MTKKELKDEIKQLKFEIRLLKLNIEDNKKVELQLRELYFKETMIKN